MAVETFPADIEFQVVDDVTNRFHAERGDTSLQCVTPDGEKMKIDLFTSGCFPDDTRPADLIGKRFNAGYISTAEYFANDLKEIHPNDLPVIR